MEINAKFIASHVFSFRYFNYNFIVSLIFPAS